MVNSETNTTTDHDEIRGSVEEHGGEPAAVRGSGNGDPGVYQERKASGEDSTFFKLVSR